LKLFPCSIFAADRPAVVDARLTDNSQDQLVASFQSLAIRDNDLPPRPDFGKVGTPVKLRANFFPVKVPKGPLYEYDVAISPTPGTARRVKRRIFKLAEQTAKWVQAGLTGNVAHDHASKLIAAKKLTMPLTITLLYYDEDQPGPKGDGKDKEFTLTFQFIQELETQSLVK
jgi:eukaryotic translation initiation factor 2C